MSSITFSDYDFLDIHLENFETFTFPISSISNLVFFNLSDKSKQQFSSNSFELIIKQTFDNPSERKNNTDDSHVAFKRIYQSSDICSLSLYKQNELENSIFIDILWDDSNPFNLQFNYWQDAEFLLDSSFRIYNSPNANKDKVSSRIEQFRANHFKTDFDMNFFNETLSELERTFLSMNENNLLDEQKAAISKSIERFQHFSNNSCFEHSFFNK